MNLQADEMTTEVMENAANAATKRREMRRRKLLADPNERMRKLMGHNNTLEETPQQPSQSQVYNGPNTDRINQRQTGQFAHNFNESQMFDRFSDLRNRDQDVFAERQPRPGVLGQNTSRPTNPMLTTTHETEAFDRQKAPSTSFMRVRYFLCIILGVIVRVSLMYSFGRRFVQSIMNPFVFLEIAYIGYMRAAGMEFGANVRGGLWLSTLLLSGVRNDVVHSYKSIVGTITAAVDDFTLYFFAFVFSHLICLLFE